MKYLIEEQSQLTEIEQLINDAKIIAVDTEFLREKTYRAELCLVQLGIGDNQYCIDVLAIEDLSCLVTMFTNPQTIKIFHAARQDMEVLYQTFAMLPTPIFDTQLAAAFCGDDMQIGYAALVENRLGIILPQSQSRTNWTMRPLSTEQFEYAADDVAHLEEIYHQLVEQLQKEGRLSWFEQELKTYYELNKYVIEPVDAYKRLAGGSLTLNQQYVLQALAQWREEVAQKSNIPRTWVIRDDGLFDLAIKQPNSVQQVKKLAVFGHRAVNKYAAIVVDIINHVEVGETLLWQKVEPFNKQQKNVCSAMMKQLASYAQELKVAQGLLATRKDIESLYRHHESAKLLAGWRQEVVGKPLMDFIAKH